MSTAWSLERMTKPERLDEIRAAHKHYNTAEMKTRETPAAAAAATV